MSQTEKLRDLNYELIKYFTNRGWKRLIVISGKEFILATGYFHHSENSNKSCNWLETTNKLLIVDYVYWFFEHVKPFWIKHNIGKIIIKGQHQSGIYYDIHVTEEGNVNDIVFPPEFGKTT